jgi:hypothetical protein
MSPSRFGGRFATMVAGGGGVALRTTLDRLKASVEAHDLYVTPINYRRYHDGPAFTDEMDSLLHKRLGFEAEHELCLLRFDEGHYGALVPKDASVSELHANGRIIALLAEKVRGPRE